MVESGCSGVGVAGREDGWMRRWAGIGEREAHADCRLQE